MKFLFVDASSTMLEKNLLPIAKYIQSKNKNFEAYFVSLELSSYISPEIELKSRYKIIQESAFEFIVFKSLRISKIKSFLISTKPDLIFIDGFRLFDQLWVGIAKQINIPVYKLQHGFEVETVFYKPLAVFVNIKKTIRMLHALYGLSCIADCRFIILLYQYSSYLFNGKSLMSTALSSIIFHPNKTFVYSEYYKEFWKNKFGFSINDMILITPIDFMLIPEIKKSKKQNACCYIAQTLVEDGRMSADDYNSLLHELALISLHTEKLIIKLHPRGNIQYYDIFNKYPNIEFTREFPNCNVYITHYSSLAYTAAFFSKKNILLEIKSHKTPDIFKKIGALIVKDVEGIYDILNDSSISEEPCLEEVKNQINYYAYYSDINPYETIFRTINNYLSPILLIEN